MKIPIVELRDGKVPPEAIMARALGAELGQRIVDGLKRVETFRVRREGGKRGDRRVVRAEIAETAQRESHAREVRRVCALFLMIVDCIRPSGNAIRKVVITRRLYIGRHDRKRHEQPPESLAGRLECTPREVSRYLAILRTIGVLDCTQPPADRVPPACRGKRSGRAYNAYRLTCELGRACCDRIYLWWHRQTPADAAAPAAPNDAPPQGPRRAPQGARDRFLEMAFGPS